MLLDNWITLGKVTASLESKLNILNISNTCVLN